MRMMIPIVSIQHDKRMERSNTSLSSVGYTVLAVRQVSWLGVIAPFGLPDWLNQWRSQANGTLSSQWRDRVGISPTSLL